VATLIFRTSRGPDAMPSDSVPPSPLLRSAIPPSERGGTLHRIIFALICGSSFLLYLHRYTWGAVKHQIAKDFKLDTDQLGILDGTFNLTYAAGQIPGGMLGDWFGAHLVLTSLIAIWSLGMGTLVFSRNFNDLVISRLLFGVAQAGCYPNLGKATKSWFSPAVRTTVQGFVTSFGRLGGAASYIIFGSLMLGHLQLPWQTAMAIFTGAGLLFAVLFFLLFRSSPQEHPLTGTVADHSAPGTTPGTAPPVVSANKTVLNWGLALRSRNIRAMLVQQFAAAFVDNVFQFWVIFYLQQEKKLNISMAGWMGALPLLGGACGGMFGGTLQSYLIGRTGNRRWVRSIVGLTGSSMAAVCMVLSTQFESATMFIAILVILKFFADWAQPTIWATITDIGGRSSASVFAIINTSGSLAGVLAGPIMAFIIQYFSDRPPLPGQPAIPTSSGWNALFFSLAAVYLTAALCWLFIDCTKPIDPEIADLETSP